MCRIYRSSRMKPYGCSLDPHAKVLREVLCGCCVVPHGVCFSLCMGVGEVGGVKGCGEIRGQRPHGAAPLPMPCGASATNLATTCRGGTPNAGSTPR